MPFSVHLPVGEEMSACPIKAAYDNPGLTWVEVVLAGHCSNQETRELRLYPLGVRGNLVGAVLVELDAEGFPPTPGLRC